MRVRLCDCSSGTLVCVMPSGHLTAEPEPGNWASPGPSSSTETQPNRTPRSRHAANKPETYLTSRAVNYSIPPNRHCAVATADNALRLTERPGLTRPAAGRTSELERSHR